MEREEGDWGGAWAAAAGYFLLGIFHVAPSVSFGDSGEFLATAANLGVTHAPGYPLYNLAARAVADWIPFGSWAYQVNVANLVFASLTAGTLFLAARRSGANRAAAAFATVLFWATPLPLHQATLTEAFTLNSFFAAALFCAVVFAPEKAWSDRTYALLGLLGGLAIGNHHTIVLLGPAILIAGWRGLGDRLGRFPRKAGVAALFTLLGFLINLYLPIRAAADPPFNWGDAESWKGFWHLFLRKDYGSLALTVGGGLDRGVANTASQLRRFLEMSVDGIGILAVVTAFLMPVEAFRRKWSWRFWGFPALAFLFGGPFFLWLGQPPFNALLNGTLERFILLPWTLAAVPAAVLLTPYLRKVPFTAVPTLAAVLLAMFTRSSWSSRGDLAAHDYGRNLLKSLPPESVLFIDGGDDTFYTLGYFQFALGLRPDLAVHDRGGLVFRNPYGSDFRSLRKEKKEERRVRIEDAASSRRPLYFSTMKSRIIPEHRLLPSGLLKRSTRDPEAAESLHWPFYAERLQPKRTRKQYRYRALVPQYSFLRGQRLIRDPSSENVALRWLRRTRLQAPDVDWVRGNGSFELVHAAFRHTREKRWKEAARLYREATRFDPAERDSWLNLGISLKESEDYLGSIEALREAIALDPGHPESYYNLGATFWMMKRWRDSSNAMAQAFRLKPDPRYLKFRDAAFQRAQAP